MFDWDAANMGHLARHDVTPVEAEEVITNDPVDLFTEMRDGEERGVVIGRTDAGRFLVVVTTSRRELIRVVTGFPATRVQISMYFREKGFLDDQAPGHTPFQE